MGTHVKLVDYTDGQLPCLLGREFQELMRGLLDPDRMSPAEPTEPSGEPIEYEALESALAYLDANAPRNDWIRFIAGIHAAPGLDIPARRELAHRFSRGELDRSGRYTLAPPERYTGPVDVDQAFNTLPPKLGGVGLGTIISEARAAGWKGNAGRLPHDIFANFVLQNESAPVRDVPDESPNAARKFRLLDEDEQDKAPDIEWLVPNAIPKNSVGMFVGKSGAGKSFIVSSLGYETAYGDVGPSFPVLGATSVAACPVVYIAAEGATGIKKARRRAWRMARGVTRKIPFHVIEVAPVAGSDDVSRMIDDIRAQAVKPGLIIVDTLAYTIPGMDENSASVAGLVMDMGQRLRKAFEPCTVLYVHHEGKNPSVPGQGRGSSAFFAASDFFYLIEGDDDTKTLTIKNVKMKDAEKWSKPRRYRGEVHGPSLVYREISEHEFGDLTKAANSDWPKRIAAALAEMEALGQEAAVTTPVLASHLVQSDGKRRSVEQGLKETNSLAARLTERVRPGGKHYNPRVAAYAVNAGCDGKPVWKWFIANEQDG